MRQFLPQHGGDQFFGRRFAVRASHRHDGQREILAICRGQATERRPCVADLNHRTFRQAGADPASFHDRCHRALLRDFAQKVVPVKAFARQRDKQISGPRMSRVRIDALKA